MVFSSLFQMCTLCPDIFFPPQQVHRPDFTFCQLRAKNWISLIKGSEILPRNVSMRCTVGKLSRHSSVGRAPPGGGMIDPSFKPHGWAAMLAAKRLAGVAPEVNLRKHLTHMPPLSMNKIVHSGFETQRRHHQKSKTGLVFSKTI